jgi:hypothetical protein
LGYIRNFEPRVRAESILLLSLLAGLAGLQLVLPQRTIAQDNSSGAKFEVGPRYVRLPENFFLLVRKGNEVGAIRFTRIEQDVEGNGKSSYETYFQGDGSNAFLKSNVIKRFGEIEIKPMKGVHAFAWQSGQNRLYVGKWWFGCYSPSLVNMSSHFSETGEGYEFAPTSARRLAEIDSSDKGLRWFRYLADSSIILPVSGLPK